MPGQSINTISPPSVVKHILQFGDGARKEILQPVGFDGADFFLKQEANRYGRDVSFANGEAKFQFWKGASKKGLTHCFDELISVWENDGFEGDVKYILQYDGEDFVIGELDFNAAITDQFRYFQAKIIQDQIEAKVKRNRTKSINLFSDQDIFGNPITPLDPSRILVKATPLTEISEWTIPQGGAVFVDFTNDTTKILGFAPQIVRSEINNTLSSFFGLSSDFITAEDCTYVTAVNSLQNVTLEISDFNYAFRNPDLNPIASANLVYRIGVNFSTATVVSTAIPGIDTNGNYTFQIPQISRDETLWVYIATSGEDDLSAQLNSVNVKLTATSTALDSVTSSVRLFDAMQQVVRSISGANIVAPEFDIDGPLGRQYISTGNQVRGIDGRSFDLSLEDILKGIKEFDADYQVRPDGVVYFGTRDPFYEDEELDRFTVAPNEKFIIEFNKRVLLNAFNVKYDKFEQGQNDDLENSREGIHTIAEFSLPNQNTFNSLDINLPWSRDPFLAEKIRRQGFDVSDETTQEDDDTVLIFDVIEDTSPKIRTGSALLNHIVTNTTVLELINQGNFNWSISGIQVGDTVTLTGSNAGSYTVGSVGQANLQLVPQAPTPNPTFTGIEFTTFTYNITTTDLVVATNQGFTSITGSTDPEGFGNMNFSIARNLRNYFGSLLKTACEFRLTGDIVNTLFRYNEDFTTQRPEDLEPIREGANIRVSDLPDRILSSRQITIEVPCTFPRAYNLMRAIRFQNGYVTITDNLQMEIKTHPKEMKYNWKSKKLEIVGENRV